MQLECPIPLCVDELAHLARDSLIRRLVPLGPGSPGPLVAVFPPTDPNSLSRAPVFPLLPASSGAKGVD